MIQLMTEAPSEQDAADHLAALKTIGGCLGGRVLPPKYQLHGWAAQTFWHVSDADAAAPLPDGMRLVTVTDSMRAALGIAS